MKLPLKFPAPFRHDHPPVRNVNEVLAERLTVGQRAADWVAGFMGSWPFVLGQSVILLLWVALNLVAWTRHWDPYPFILLNLFLSLEAAYTAPVIMMSQNRQSLKDRLEAHNDFEVNQKTEAEVRAILEHLEAQNRALEQLSVAVESLRRRLGDTEPPTGNGGDARTG